MKKFILVFVMLGMLLTAAFASPMQALAADDGNTVLVMKGKEKSEAHEIEIDVSVKENTGVCAMLLSLVYDTSVFTLIDLEHGEAFSSLSPIHTNTETEEGYGIYPFKITYLGEENDTSVGHMMTLRFRVREDAPDGSYTITLKHERDQGVTYLKGNEILTKNLLIDGAVVTRSGNKITSVNTVPDSSETNEAGNDSNGAWLPIAIGVAGGVAVTGGCSFLVLTHIKRKKLKKWKKL